MQERWGPSSLGEEDPLLGSERSGRGLGLQRGEEKGKGRRNGLCKERWQERSTRPCLREPTTGAQPSLQGVSVSCEQKDMSSARTCHSAEAFGFHSKNGGEPLADFRQQRGMNSLTNTASYGPKAPESSFHGVLS